MPNTIFLAESLRFWPSPSFSAVLKNELEALPAGQLPLPLVRGNATL